MQRGRQVDEGIASLRPLWAESERRLYSLATTSPAQYEQALRLVRATADELRAAGSTPELLAALAGRARHRDGRGRRARPRGGRAARRAHRRRRLLAAAWRAGGRRAAPGPAGAHRGGPRRRAHLGDAPGAREPRGRPARPLPVRRDAPRLRARHRHHRRGRPGLRRPQLRAGHGAVRSLAPASCSTPTRAPPAGRSTTASPASSPPARPWPPGSRSRRDRETRW